MRKDAIKLLKEYRKLVDAKPRAELSNEAKSFWLENRKNEEFRCLLVQRYIGKIRTMFRVLSDFLEQFHDDEEWILFLVNELDAEFIHYLEDLESSEKKHVPFD